MTKGAKRDAPMFTPPRSNDKRFPRSRDRQRGTSGEKKLNADYADERGCRQKWWSFWTVDKEAPARRCSAGGGALNAAEPALAAVKLGDRRLEIFGGELRPHSWCEVQLRVRALPQ